MDYLSDCFEIVKNEISNNLRLKEEKELIYQNKLKNGKTFVIDIYYREGDVKFEEINIEGYENALKLFEIYKNSYKTLKLHKIAISLNDEKIRGIKFVN